MIIFHNITDFIVLCPYKCSLGEQKRPYDYMQNVIIVYDVNREMFSLFIGGFH